MESVRLDSRHQSGNALEYRSFSQWIWTFWSSQKETTVLNSRSRAQAGLQIESPEKAI